MEVVAKTGIFSLLGLLGHCKADLGCRPLHLQGLAGLPRPAAYSHGSWASISVPQPQQHLSIFVHTLGPTSSRSHQKWSH